MAPTPWISQPLALRKASLVGATIFHNLRSGQKPSELSSPKGDTTITLLLSDEIEMVSGCSRHLPGVLWDAYSKEIPVHTTYHPL